MSLQAAANLAGRIAAIGPRWHPRAARRCTKSFTPAICGLYFFSHYWNAL
jgi:hypothetical protein